MSPQRPCSFGNEMRFQDTAGIKYNSSSTQYMPQSTYKTKAISFTLASRFTNNPCRSHTNFHQPINPYDINRGFLFSSEHPLHNGIRFATCPRKSLALNTPGAIYQIEEQYATDPKKRYPMSFSKEVRFQEIKPIQTNPNPQIFMPPAYTRTAISMGKKLRYKDASFDTPGPIYNVHVSSKHIISFYF